MDMAYFSHCKYGLIKNDVLFVVVVGCWGIFKLSRSKNISWETFFPTTCKSNCVKKIDKLHVFKRSI